MSNGRNVTIERPPKERRAMAADWSGGKDHRRNNKLECVIAIVSSRNTTEASPWCAVDSSDEGHQ